MERTDYTDVAAGTTGDVATGATAAGATAAGATAAGGAAKLKRY